MTGMIDCYRGEARTPNEPLRPGCCHKVIEDCLCCVACGRCREDLGEDDLCMDCGTTA